MPFLLITIGVVILASAIKGTTAQLGQQFIQDLKGTGSATDTKNPGYVLWVSSIIAVGALGYYAPAQKLSRAFMFLIISGMLIANKGVFAQIQTALQHPVEPSTGTNSGTTTATTGSTATNASAAASTGTTLATASAALDTAIV